MRNLELLSPAGDQECIEAAVRFGADACYLGGSFLQLRAASVGFSLEGIAQAAQYLHRNDVMIVRGKNLKEQINLPEEESTEYRIRIFD